MTLEYILIGLIVFLIIAIVAESYIYRQAIAVSRSVIAAGEVYATSFQILTGTLAAVSAKVAEIETDTSGIDQDLSIMRGILEVHTAALNIKSVEPLFNSMTERANTRVGNSTAE